MMDDYIDHSLREIIEKEGNYKSWVYKCTNGIEYTCEVKRNPRSLHLCGYVLLTDDSDFFGVEYDDIPVNCHGGLTYGSQEKDFWIIGFDCAHLGDFQPGYNLSDGEYRNMDYVMNQCESICEQISIRSKSHRRTIKLQEIL